MKKYLLFVIFLPAIILVHAQNNDDKEKKVSFVTSGYVNLNGIFDFNGLEDFNDFTTSQIPINPSPYQKTFRYHMTAEQSRLNFGVRYKTPLGDVKAFISGDFVSGKAGVFRFREAYLEFGHWLLGQTNTTFGNPNIVPATIDFEGPNSATTLRNPMIKYSHNLKKNWSYILAFESRGTDTHPFYYNGEVVLKEFSTTIALVGTINKTGDWGLVSLSGMSNMRPYFNVDTVEHVTASYGAAFSLILNTYKKNHFNIFLIAGKGVSNFISDLSGNGYNGVPNTDGSKLVMLNSVGGFVSYTQNWSKKFSSNFIFSYIDLEKTDLLPKTDFKHSSYALANLFYAPIDRLVFGVEYVWGKLTIQSKDNGTANRFQFLAQFNF